MPRSRPEWLGKTHDTPVPPGVRLRVWKRDGMKCVGCGRPLPVGAPFQTDHIKELILDGENRESNLQTLGEKCCSTHKDKTREAVKLRSQGDRKLKRLLGLTKSRNPMPGSKRSGIRKSMSGSVQRKCVECGTNWADWPSKICVGCDAYKEHTA